MELSSLWEHEALSAALSCGDVFVKSRYDSILNGDEQGAIVLDS